MTKKINYVVCPLCARNRALDTNKKGSVRWDFWNENSLIIQVRSAPGGKIKDSGRIHKGRAPGLGFHLIKEDSLILEDILEDKKYKKLINNIKNQIIKINKIFVDKKIIKKSELKF